MRSTSGRGAAWTTASFAASSCTADENPRAPSPLPERAARRWRRPRWISFSRMATAVSPTMPEMAMAFDEIRNHAAKLEADIASGPILPRVTPDEIRRHLARYDFARPLDPDEVTADVEAMLRTWQVHVTHPRYFGLFNPSVTLASIAADTLVAMYNPQLAAWRTSPAANEIERHTLAWLAGKFGLPADTVAHFTTGGAEANLSAVIVALTRAFPEYGEAGLRSLSASPTIYLTHEAHDSFNKIAHMTGIGRRALRTVATDRDLKMDLVDLGRRVAEDRRNGLAP